jgi:hypothetical protein
MSAHIKPDLGFSPRMATGPRRCRQHRLIPDLFNALRVKVANPITGSMEAFALTVGDLLDFTKVRASHVTGGDHPDAFLVAGEYVDTAEHPPILAPDRGSVGALPNASAAVCCG